jgi:DNA-binding NarL/FixJ family response regulator
MYWLDLPMSSLVRRKDLLMGTAISSLLPAASASTSSLPTPQAAPPAASVSADTVKLSEAQQVYQLYNQGQRVSQIAATLSLTEAAVNSYLSLPSS